MSGAAATEQVAAAPALRGPLGRKRRLPFAGSDWAYWTLLYGVGLVFVAVCGDFIYSIVDNSLPVWRHSGIFGFLFGTVWDPQTNQYGAWPLLVGTLETTLIALLLAVPTGILCAVSIIHLIPKRVRTPLSAFVELLAAVPSVVYGLIGVLVLAPWCQAHLFPWLQSTTHNFVLFSGAAFSGYSLLLASLVLFVMVLPTIVAFSRDAIATVPHEQVEGALSVGATKWQTIWRVVLPSARTGITGAVTLGVARALGETIAVAMVIGGGTSISASLLQPGGTMAATIATEWDGASALQTAAFFGLGMILIALTASVNIIGRQLLRRASVGETK